MDEPGSSATHCYCNVNEIENHMIPCIVCKRFYHRSCLQNGPPSALTGDVYFKFSCQNCTENGKETIERIKMQWTLVVILALFNLQLKESGKCGFYRWREDICSFINQHWAILFGADRKKAATWHHTVAGTLSANCNRYFLSGADILGEKGWWALKEMKLPTLDDLESMANINKLIRKSRAAPVQDFTPIIDGPRLRPNVLESALELKAKRTATFETESNRKKRKMKAEDYQVKITLSKNISDLSSNSDIFSQASYSSSDADLSNSSSSFNIKVEKDFGNDAVADSSNDAENIAQWIKHENICDNALDFEVDVGASHEPSISTNLLDVTVGDLFQNKKNLNAKNIKVENSFENDNDTYVRQPKGNSNQKKILENQHLDIGRKRKALTKHEPKPIEDVTIIESKFMSLTAYEEHQLLTQLEALQPLRNVKARNLYRKLIVRKLKREHNIPLFNIDNFIREVNGLDPIETNISTNVKNLGRQEILDRYQMLFQPYSESPLQNMSFVSRLMGLDDDDLSSIISPFTKRTLKPFIFRDYETEPLKLKFLHELVAYSHRKDSTWVSPPRHPIDYSYVRPQHIPAINAMCQEFFWPGIDLSESLQYPDFSCVALYRKVVVGFAFMVPDVKYDEAYITFIFCHPDWRRCGIATFMLYHLIQTCVGKDITLHVSAKSPAVLLYQKFGFKVEEYILDFYEKYLPATSKECRHALFLRLNR